MTYRLFITPRAQREIQEFVEHLRAYSEGFAEEQLARLSFEVSTYVLQTPFLWNYFFLTGDPYHGYLFRIGQRHHYWVIYSIGETDRAVHVVRFWSANQDSENFET